MLLPVLDDAKHYWVAPDEVDKLLRAGDGWLATHPERELITRRYLAPPARARDRSALARLAEVDDPTRRTSTTPGRRDVDRGRRRARRVPLAAQRRGPSSRRCATPVRAACSTSAAASGALLRELLEHAAFTEVVGVDVSPGALERAARRLRLDADARAASATGHAAPVVALTYRDARLAGYDAAVLMEVIEHVDPPRLPALERSVFGTREPAPVVVTTPNVEYNVRYEALPAGELRHRDHRFEWTRAEFAAWADRRRRAPRLHGRASCRVGDDDPEVGPPTQLAVFRARRRRDDAARRIPEPVPGRPRRRLRLGQVHLRPQALRPTEVLSTDFFRGLVADDENDQSATARRVRRAALHRRQAAGGRPAHRRRRHQRAAARPRAAGRAGPRARRAAGRDRARRARGRCACERNAARPDRDFGAHVVRRQRDRAATRRCGGCAREGFRKVHVLQRRRGGRRGRASCASSCSTTCATRHGPFDVIGDVHGCRAELEHPARPARLRHRPRRRGTRRSTRATPRAGGRSSSATWSTAAPTPPACCAW